MSGSGMSGSEMGGAMKFSPRPAQREYLEYTGGKLGVAAVPGSGKTRTLSALAARRWPTASGR